MAQARPTIIRLEGEWDFYRSGEVPALLEPARNAERVILDLSDVRYVDSTLITHFMRMRNERPKEYPAVRLVIANPSVRRIFDIAQLGRVWPIFTTVEEAASSFD